MKVVKKLVLQHLLKKLNIPASETQAEERRRRGAESFDLAFAKAYRSGRDV